MVYWFKGIKGTNNQNITGTGSRMEIAAKIRNDCLGEVILNQIVVESPEKKENFYRQKSK